MYIFNNDVIVKRKVDLFKKEFNKRNNHLSKYLYIILFFWILSKNYFFNNYVFDKVTNDINEYLKSIKEK